MKSTVMRVRRVSEFVDHPIVGTFEGYWGGYTVRWKVMTDEGPVRYEAETVGGIRSTNEPCTITVSPDGDVTVETKSCQSGK